jgi:two-component system, sensor histidine kinase and response regulator
MIGDLIVNKNFMNPSEEHPIKQQSILIVDDMMKNIQLIDKLLAHENLKIAYTTNATEAVELAEHNNFDLFLLDIMMPIMDGYELCKALKSNTHTAEVPVIFLTAKTDPDSIVQGFESGAQDYVTKPFNTAELVARVRTQLLMRRNALKLKELNDTLEKKVHQRTAELELANRQVRQLEKAKSEFLSLISHELRTPLNGIAGLSGLLNETELEPEQKKYLEHLQEASFRLVKFSEIARLITGLRTRKHNVDFYNIAIDLLVEVAMDETKQKLIEKNIQLSFNKPAQHIFIHGDSDLIRQSISILLEYIAEKIKIDGRIEIDIQGDDETWLTLAAHTPLFSKSDFDSIKKQCESESQGPSENLGINFMAIKLIMDVHSGSLRMQMNEDNHIQLSLVFNKNT